MIIDCYKFYDVGHSGMHARKSMIYCYIILKIHFSRKAFKAVSAFPKENHRVGMI